MPYIINFFVFASVFTLFVKIYIIHITQCTRGGGGGGGGGGNAHIKIKISHIGTHYSTHQEHQTLWTVAQDHFQCTSAPRNEGSHV